MIARAIDDTTQTCSKLQAAKEHKIFSHACVVRTPGKKRSQFTFQTRIQYKKNENTLKHGGPKNILTCDTRKYTAKTHALSSPRFITQAPAAALSLRNACVAHACCPPPKPLTSFQALSSTAYHSQIHRLSAWAMSTPTNAPSAATPNSAFTVEHVALIRSHSHLQVIRNILQFNNAASFLTSDPLSGRVPPTEG
jgi:hypothetical protein